MGRGPTEAYHRSLNEDYVKGTLTCLKPETIMRVVNSEFPNVMNIEPTNACNLRCSCCPRASAAKGVGYMQWEMFARLIDEAADRPQLLMLHLFKDGESFLHPRFFDMLEYAARRQVARTMHLNTNAVCWTDLVIEQLLDSGLDDITVSLDADCAATFYRLKGVDCYDRVERQVRRFFERRAQRGLKRPFVRVKIMEFEGLPQEEIRTFFSRWEGMADAVQVTGMHNWSGAIPDLKVTDERAAARFPCALIWYSLVINWNGEAAVCSVDWNTEILLGNVKQQTIHQIWNCSKLKELRRAHLEGRYDLYPVCKDCVVWVSVGDLREWFAANKALYT